MLRIPLQTKEITPAQSQLILERYEKPFGNVKKTEIALSVIHTDYQENAGE